MKIVLFGLLAFGPFLVNAQEIKTFISPGVSNGLKVVGFPTSTTMSSNVVNYINRVMVCTFNYDCGELQTAQDNFSSDSDMNGICKVLGFEKSLGYTGGDIINVFGRVLNVNSEGEVISVKTKEFIFMPKTKAQLREYFSKRQAETREGWSKQVGGIEIMYVPMTENAVTSITCI